MMPALVPDAVRRNPFPLYAQLRRFTPVLHVPGRDFYLLFDHADVRRAITDEDTFSSAAVPPGGRAPEWLLFMDPPRHTRLRAIAMKAFPRGSLAAFEPRLRRFSAHILDESLPRGRMDLFSDYAALLPAMAIAELLGMPLLELPRLQRWSDAIANLSQVLAGGERAQAAARSHAQARLEMREYLESRLAQRSGEQDEGILTRMSRAEIDGTCLSVEELLGFFELLLSAGTETAASLIASAVVCLLDHPGELTRLRQAPTLLPSAIEEVLRFRSPAQMVFRQTTRAVRLHRTLIPANRLVLPVIGSANRDATAFEAPDRFDIARTPNDHLAFGHGIHFCLGAALARMQARVALEDLLGRLHGLRAASKRPWKPREALHLHGPSSLPIEFDVMGRREAKAIDTDEHR
jgi:cytochrome P450